MQHQESSPTHDTLAWTRDRLRRVLLDWAREIAEAETRGQLVGVLVRAHEYADRITRIAGMNDVSNRVIGGTDTTEGRATPGFEQIQERPELPRRRRIEEYDPAELDALVRWVTQTEPELELDDLVARVCTELGFKRRGRRIVAGIRGAVERVVSAR